MINPSLRKEQRVVEVEEECCAVTGCPFRPPASLPTSAPAARAREAQRPKLRVRAEG
jgi:hypothetical protein